MITEKQRENYINKLTNNSTRCTPYNIFVDLDKKGELEDTLIIMFIQGKILSEQALKHFFYWLYEIKDEDVEYRYVHLNSPSLARLYMIALTGYSYKRDNLEELKYKDIVYQDWFSSNFL